MRLLLLVCLLAGCTVAEPFNRVERPVEPGEGPCRLGEESTFFRAEASLEGSTYWDCVVPDGAGSPAFDGFAGLAIGVNGGSLALQLFPEEGSTVTERDVYVAVEGRRGFQVTRLTQDPDTRVPFDLLLSTGAPGGDYTVMVAMDQGGTPEEPLLGDWLRIPISIIRVAAGGADIQVTVSWLNADGGGDYTDVDLHVIDPNGDQVAYWNTEVASGGQLDLDSNPACAAGDFNENIFWPVGRAIVGEYRVQLNYWSTCGYTGEVDYRVTILIDGQLQRIIDGTLTAADEGPDELYLDIAAFTW